MSEPAHTVSPRDKWLAGTAIVSVALGLFAIGCQSWSGSFPGLRITTATTSPIVSPDSVAAGGEAAHAELFANEGPFPSAAKCAACHPDHYREWSVSPHAYAQMSPVFNAMHGTILKRTNGTNGDFCIRCHTPTGMALKEPLFTSNLNRHPVSREGITCIVCHRIDAPYGKVSGRQALAPGGVFDSVRGPTGDNTNLEQLGARVARQPGETGVPGHGRLEALSQIDKSGFCGACHDVTLMNGFRLEEAFSEFKGSPSAMRGESCQDCHMGYTPGVPGTYKHEPVAVVAGQTTPPRKRTNHMFVGPDYSVIHPALFPHKVETEEMASLAEWLTFDWKAGWGTDDFEDTVSDDQTFPERWADVEDRYVAREEIIDPNLDLLREAERQRLALLQAGYTFGELKVDRADASGLRFRVQVCNGTDGHAVPTGFDAERLVFLRVTVTDADGTVVMQSGDLDPNGDLRDLHSVYVHNHEIKRDEQLFSLQSKFITRNERGGEREQVLAVNFSPDPLPFLRPSTISTILTGRPGGARKHKQGIVPGDCRWAPYRVESSALTGRGPYTARIDIVAGMVPVNLIHEIQEVGFDYGLSPRGLADAVVYGVDTGSGGSIEGNQELTGHMTLHSREILFDVHGTPSDAAK